MNSLECLKYSKQAQLTKIGESFKTLGRVAQRAMDVFSRMWEVFVKFEIASYPHKHSLYLATHGSPRVQKKNRKRYQRYLKKQIRRRT